MGLATIADAAPDGSSKLVHGFWLFIAQLAGYGIVWVGAVLLPRQVVLQGHSPWRGADASAELDELHQDFPI